MKAQQKDAQSMFKPILFLKEDLENLHLKTIKKVVKRLQKLKHVTGMFTEHWGLRAVSNLVLVKYGHL